MKQALTSHNSANHRLILLFAGWAMDAKPFAHLSRPGYDVMVVWDYRDDTFDHSLIDGYDEIAVVAWSYGVRPANDTLAGRGLPVSATIAVNGTLYPVDDRRGIPRRIFGLTRRSLSDRALDTFYRRMFANNASYERFAATRPDRTVADVSDELGAFAREYDAPAEELQWNHILVGTRDAIIDSRNQLEAWGADRCTLLSEAPHYVDLQQVIDKYIVAKDIVAKSFRRHATTYDANAGIQAQVATRLWQLVGEHCDLNIRRGFVIEVGSGTGLLTRLYTPVLRCDTLRLWDISGHVPAIEGLPEGCVETCDAEMAIRQLDDNSVDILLSSATLQWFNDLPTFLEQTERVLRPGGIAAFAYFTTGTCRELTVMTGNSLPFAMPATLPTGIICDINEEIRCDFATPADVLKHLRLTGVNSLGNKHMPNSRIREIMERYPLNADGTAPLTYSIHYLIIRNG